jgi:hypothetical protein
MVSKSFWLFRIIEGFLCHTNDVLLFQVSIFSNSKKRGNEGLFNMAQEYSSNIMIPIANSNRLGITSNNDIYKFIIKIILIRKNLWELVNSENQRRPKNINGQHKF